jgi:hypothetical protein
MTSHDESLSRAAGLDSLSHTFIKDREFCEALAKAQPKNTARLLAYLRWSKSYMPEIQLGLHDLVDQHFPRQYAHEARLWTMSLTEGVTRDVGLVPYLAIRGLIWEAGVATRRGLENVGLLAHLWREPSKARYLNDADGKDFRNAFVNEVDKVAANQLQARRVQKRFAASSMSEQLSQLYRVVSTYSVHGASPNQLVTSQLAPTRLSCMFVHRPDPTTRPLGRDLELFGNACEMLCSEVAFIYGSAAKTYKTPNPKAFEGGRLLSALMDNGPSSSMDALIGATLNDLGWTKDAYS